MDNYHKINSLDHVHVQTFWRTGRTYANTKKYILSRDFPNNFLKAYSYLDIMKYCANFVKTNIEVPFKKPLFLTLRICFEKYTVWRVCRALLFITFNIIISYIFPGNFIEIDSLKSLRRYEFLLLTFQLFLSILWIFLLLLATKTSDISIYKIISAVFWLVFF